MNTKRKQNVVTWGVLVMGCVFVSEACAKPTTEEKRAFIAQEKRDKEAFDLSILKQTDPRAAASTEFYNKAKSDRIAFIKSIAGLPQAEKSEQLAQYNRSALAARQDFEKKLQTIPFAKDVKMNEIVQKRKKFEQERRQKAKAFYAD